MVGDSFGQLMAEYTVGRIISHERDWFECHQNQVEFTNNFYSVYFDVPLSCSLNVLIVNISSEVMLVVQYTSTKHQIVSNCVYTCSYVRVGVVCIFYSLFLLCQQLKGLWLHEKKIHYYRSLQDLVVGILGMGNIGKEGNIYGYLFSSLYNEIIRTAVSVNLNFIFYPSFFCLSFSVY